MTFAHWLGLILLLPISVNAQSVRAVRIMAKDDLGLSAAYYTLETNHAPAVILLHGFGKNRDEWIGIAQMLQQHGIAVLAFDLRGHGESTRRLTVEGAQLVDYHNFKARDYKDMLFDIDLVYDWLAGQPGIDKHHIALVGSGLGANLALRYAIFNDEVAGLILLSPGLNYQDVRTDDVILRYGKRPLRIAVSHDDRYAFESCKNLIEVRKEHKQALDEGELTVCSGGIHGAEMLTGVKGLSAALFGWLQGVLQDTPPPK